MRRFSPGLLIMVLVAALVAAVPGTARAAGGIEVRPDQRHQRIDGFGYATAFGRTQLVYNLPADRRDQLLDLLLGRDGAAPSILRLGISSTSSSIQPTDPGGPDAPPQYRWDGWDDGQAWFAAEAEQRGVHQFYADAWSAPAT